MVDVEGWNRASTSPNSFTVSNVGETAFIFGGQYGVVENPPLFFVAGQTFVFSLIQGSTHPFHIRFASDGLDITAGLIHVSMLGVVTSGMAANGQVSGTLFWTIPITASSVAFVYQCSVHSTMLGKLNVQTCSTNCSTVNSGAVGAPSALSSEIIMVIAIVASIILVLVIVIIFCLCRRRNSKPVDGKSNGIHATLGENYYTVRIRINGYILFLF